MLLPLIQVRTQLGRGSSIVAKVDKGILLEMEGHLDELLAAAHNWKEQTERGTRVSANQQSRPRLLMHVSRSAFTWYLTCPG